MGGSEPDGLRLLVAIRERRKFLASTLAHRPKYRNVGSGFGGLLRTMVNEINNKSYNLKLIHHNFDMPYVQNLFSWFTANDKICKKAQDNELLNINICDISKFDFIKKK